MIKKMLPNMLFIAGLYYGQTTPSPTENYIYTKTYLSDPTLSNPKAKETVQYMDGLGRPIQSVDVKGSPLGRDVVVHIEYDAFGRQAFDFLPVPQSGTLNGAIVPSSLSNATQPDIYGQEKIFSEKTFENSPLNRVLEQKGTGSAWSNKPVRFTYDFNTSADGVKKFITATTWENGATKSVSSNSGVYPDNQLYKNIVTDEDGNKTIRFTNGQGQTILSRKVLSATENADTYYIYNEYNQLALVVPPLLSKIQNWTSLNQDELAYEYRYDNKNRLVEKKLPGKGWEYMVYDKADRLILTQDANLRTKGQWLFTKYDQFSRPIYTGLLDSAPGRAEQVNAIANQSSNIETRSTSSWNNSGMDVFYTNSTAYPTTNFKLLSVNYYDTYPQGAPSVQGKILDQDILPQATAGNSLTSKGLLLASFSKNTEDDSWTKNYTYYDTKGRSVRTHSVNYLGGYTITDSKLDFTGIPQTVVTQHKRLNSDAEKVITETFEYDLQNRLKKHWHQIGNLPQELLVENTYNELSELKNKKLGNNLQSVDYSYNIKGWLTKINEPSNLNGKLFGFEVKYQNPVFSDLGAPKYNGKISEVDWRTLNDDVLKRYNYQYDALGRLEKGIYSEPSSSIIRNNYYNEEMSYDINGNIKSLVRNSKPVSGNTPTVIDNLIYHYYHGNNSNKLEKVVSQGPDNSFGYVSQGNSFTYDLNGNMADFKDHGRGFINYNFLNLPTVFDGEGYDYVKYNYSAEGTKLKKTEWYAFKNRTIEMDYLDGFQYTNGALTFVPTAEGYYSFETNRYIYNYTDHLGNIRLSYSKKPDGTGAKIVDENNYYPFGLKHELSYALNTDFSYNYEYNGKEFQGLAGQMYDYGARFYIPSLGRWGAADELSEKFNANSHYAYVVNDPINGYDPDGRDIIFLADSKAVPVAGHGAVIVGNEKDGWYYYSMNGTGTGSRPYGDSKNPDIGTFLGKGISPKQAMLKANTVNPKETHHYDKFKTVKTTKEEDKMIKSEAAASASAKKYCVIGQSCANVMLSALNKIVDIRTDNAWYVPTQMNPSPNSIVNNLENSMTYYNSLFISRERHIEFRKVGKLVVGPIIDSKGIEHY